MPDIRALLEPACACGNKLRTAADHERGHCDGCHLTRHGPSGFDYHAAQRRALPFRSEADAYRESIYDDD